MQLPNNLVSLTEALAKLPQKKIAQAINICLLAYIAYLAAQMTWLFAPSSPIAQVNKHSVVKSGNTQGTTVDLSRLQALNLFGTFDAKNITEEVIVEDVQDAPETKLNLMLSGVVASSNRTLAAAIIEKSGKQATYGLGDTIIGTRATLHNVLNDRVLIKQSGRIETLMLDGYKYQKMSAKQISTPEKQKNREVRPNFSSPNLIDQRQNKQLKASVQALKESINEDPGKITDYLKIAPKRSNGKISGYRLMPGKKPEFFKTSGLKAGDIAVQMNGFDLTVPTEAALALQALKKEKEVSLLIDRNGEMTEILFGVEN